MSFYNRKKQQKVSFMVGKKCRLGKRNELGTRVFDFKGGEQDSVVWGYMGTMRRTTSLGREASLRLEMRIKSEYFQRLKRAGVFKCQAFKDNRESINKTIRFLRERLARYKERRLKFGLFYLAPHNERLAVVVVSHLKHMPLKEALRRSRLDLDRRRRILERYNARRQPPALSSPTAKLVLYTVCSVFLACLIILC